MTGGKLAEEMHLSFQATSRHLITLERAGLLEKDQRGTEIFYRLAKPARPFIDHLLTEL
jgi:DNA-binding transcriptional ArsR family regulator